MSPVNTIALKRISLLVCGLSAVTINIHMICGAGLHLGIALEDAMMIYACSNTN